MKPKKRQPSGAHLAIKNDILRALLNSEYRHLSPKLEQVDLKFGQIICCSRRWETCCKTLASSRSVTAKSC
jgi:hypothetical protein